jgi:hypothetical protein
VRGVVARPAENSRLAAVCVNGREVRGRRGRCERKYQAWAYQDVEEASHGLPITIECLTRTAKCWRSATESCLDGRVEHRLRVAES